MTAELTFRNTRFAMVTFVPVDVRGLSPLRNVAIAIRVAARRGARGIDCFFQARGRRVTVADKGL